MNSFRPYLLAPALLLAACHQDYPVPADQAEFNQTVATIQESYRRAESTRNQIRIDDVERTARAALELKNPLIGWRGEVSHVGSLAGRNWVLVDSGNVAYRVSPEGEEAKEEIAKLAKGDIVSFSGFAEIETSLTWSGAIKSPSYWVRASTLERVWDL